MKSAWRFILIAIAIFLCGDDFVRSVEANASVRKPNIIFILADDMGYGGLGCYRATRIKTPNIDRIANEGIRFTDGHCAASTCTPTRYGFLTGRYPFRSWCSYSALSTNAPLLIEPNRPTVASFLKSNGYATSIIGKWHLGYGEEEGFAENRGNTPPNYWKPRGKGPDWNGRLTPGPPENGFDYSYVIPVANSFPPYVIVENDHVVGLRPDSPIGKMESRNNGKMEGGEGARWKDEDLVDMFTKKLVKQVEDYAQGDKPFFMFYAAHQPHVPWRPNKRFKGSSQAGAYGDVIQELDWSVGELLKTLDRLKLADNTIVIFSSDNGSSGRNFNGHRANGKLRGGKGDLTEGGHRVPFIVRWPGKIKPGQVSNVLVSQSDLFATFAAIINKPLLKGAAPDSYNILPALLGKELPDPERPLVMSSGGTGMLSIRSGKWKLMPGQGDCGYREFFSKKPWPAPTPGDPPAQLYNLDEDVGERKNLYLKHPDIVHRLKVNLEKIRADETYDPKKPEQPKEPLSVRQLNAMFLSPNSAARIASNEDSPASETVVASPKHVFDSTVAPILAANCLSCHSGAKPKGKLNLSSRAAAMRGVPDGPVIVPGKLDDSFLWDEIESDNMPPKHPLSKADKKVIRQWIETGAKWGTDPIDPFQFSSDRRAGRDWWSLQRLKKQPPPQSRGDHWSRNAIDQFVLAKLINHKLDPSPRADPRTLVRRLYIDLIGLPAPVEVIEKFATNPSQEAWEQLVDKLLASKRYGERWARHWLDVARFGESSGFEYNSPRESAWHYRDWVIRALNDNMPYDQFVRMQLAGDILKPDTVEGAAAVGFLVAGVHNKVQGKNPKMRMAGRQEELEEISSVVGQAFLGMTVHCARCHDHKFDPITAKEYYQFIAALDGIRHGRRKIKTPSPNGQAPAGQVHKLKHKLVSLRRLLADRIISRGGQLSSTANILNSKQSVPANQRGSTYHVSFLLAPTVWAGASQATASGDGVIVRLINPTNGILRSQFFPSRGWDNGGNAGKFRPVSFTYRGDGSGPIHIQLQPYPLNAGRFGGAVDDLEIRHGDTLLFQDDFNQLKQRFPHGVQAHTQRRVYHSALSDRWQHTGTNTIHAELRSESNLALQLYGGRKAPALKPVTENEMALQRALVAVEKQLERSPQSSQTEVHTVLSEQPVVMRVHDRGSVETLGEEVSAGGLSAIAGLSADFNVNENAPDAQRRLNLSRWIANANNPLFQRVAVNRIWHYHFGQGLVKTPSDFGFNGGQPSHLRLLDWLAVWFRDNGYSLKKLHRLIATSSTYQQVSRGVANPTYAMAKKIDQGNRLLWRQNPRRVEAEVYRDSVLQVAGVLNPKMYGPGFKDVRIDQVPPAYYYVAIDPVGPQFNRRTIYRWQPRGQRSALLDTFDCPDPSVTTPRRSVTTTPSQALSQWNHPFVLRMSDHLAKRTVMEVGQTLDKQVTQLWRSVLGRSPDDTEFIKAKALAEKRGLALLARVLFNSNEFIWIE